MSTASGICSLADSRTDRWRPGVLPAVQLVSGATPFPAVAWVRRMLLPAVGTTWAWWRMSGINTSSSGLSLTTSRTTTCTGPTARSINDPQRRRNRRTPTDNSRFESFERHAAAASSTNTGKPPDQPRHDVGHPHPPSGAALASKRQNAVPQRNSRSNPRTLRPRGVCSAADTIRTATLAKLIWVPPLPSLL